MTKLDDMLAKWPLAESTQLEADEAAERVVGAINAGQIPAAIDDALFAAPLPQLDSESTLTQTSAPRASRSSMAGALASGIAVESKMSKDRTRDRTSFQELAKMATTPPPPQTQPPSAVSSGSLTPPPPSASSSGSSGVVRGEEASSSDSGIVDLKAIASADPSGEQRAQSTPLASSGLFEDESAPAKPAVSAAAAAAATSAAPPSARSSASSVAPAVAATDAKSAVATEKKKGGGGVVIVLGALVAAAAIAAGGFFFIKYQRSHQAVALNGNAVAVETKGANPTKKAAVATPTAIGSIAQADDVPDMDTTQPTQNGKPMTKYRAHTGGGAVASAAATADPAPTGTIDPKLVANLPVGGAGGGSGDLSEAMKAAAGGGMGLKDNTPTGGGGSQYAAGSVPQRPSQGQVQGAIGAVMPNAKACLNADDPISRANITFQSDGSVKNISITGFAAGKPQEACIKAALSKATVSPFAESSYSVPASIRP